MSSHVRTALTMVLAALVSGACTAQGAAPSPAPTASPAAGAAGGAATDAQTLYALGASIGKSIAVFGLTREELEHVKRGMTDSVTGGKLEVDPAALQPKIQEMARARAGKAAAAEDAKSTAFREAAAAEPGAVKLESGVIYREITKGSGPSPKPSDVVKVHYRGTLVDGTEFDSSHKRGEPAEFPLGGVIPCWTEGVQKMAVGGKAKLVCPASKAYGDRGSPPTIPGGATLVFEVELLEIKGQAGK